MNEITVRELRNCDGDVLETKAQGWSEYAAEDPTLAQWLEHAARQRELRR